MQATDRLPRQENPMRQCQHHRRRDLFQQPDPLYHRSSRWSKPFAQEKCSPFRDPLGRRMCRVLKETRLCQGTR
jgi:hypothetical protein